MTNDDSRLMGIDHGEKRIGVALSDPLAIIASPVEVVVGTPIQAALEHLVTLVNEQGVSKIVVGLPTDSEGGIGSQATTVLRWARRLADLVNVPVVLWDESFSTLDAQKTSKGGKRQADLDAVAAAVMLQSYLEARRSSDEPGQPLHAFDENTP